MYLYLQNQNITSIDRHRQVNNNSINIVYIKRIKTYKIQANINETQTNGACLMIYVQCAHVMFLAYILYEISRLHMCNSIGYANQHKLRYVI